MFTPDIGLRILSNMFIQTMIGITIPGLVRILDLQHDYPGYPIITRFSLLRICRHLMSSRNMFYLTYPQIATCMYD